MNPLEIAGLQFPQPDRGRSWMSMRMRSGRRLATAAIASWPFSASVSSQPALPSKSRRIAGYPLDLRPKDTLGHDLTCRSIFVGTVNENVEPLPGIDSTQMRPPCISTIRFDMASPSPVPPFFLVIELSAC
jgi:hypothetical protein